MLNGCEKPAAGWDSLSSVIQECVQTFQSGLQKANERIQDQPFPVHKQAQDCIDNECIVKDVDTLNGNDNE